MEKDFLVSLFLQDDILEVNQAVALTMKNILDINNQSMETLKRNTNEHFPNPNASHNNIPYFERTVQSFSEAEYKKYFKMSKSTMQKLLDYLKEKSSNLDRMIVAFEKKVHLTVWLLINKDSYNVAGNLFGLHKSSVSYIFHEICSLITECRHDFIKWPSQDYQNATRSRIKNAYNFPNCVGFIDGCTIQVKAPKQKIQSVLLQGVCDDKLRFLDIYIGHAGNFRDAKMFTMSPLHEKIEDLVDSGNHILGDSVYPLNLNIMTPFRDNGKLTEAEKNYNLVHSKARMCIRRAFGRLISKFKRLKCLEVFKIADVSIIISAACVLHNFILINEADEEAETPSNEEFNLQIDNLSPVTKRNLICDYISGSRILDTTENYQDYHHFKNLIPIIEHGLITNI